MEDVLLVCWIEDKPITFDIQRKTAISDGNFRAMPGKSLIGKVVPMYWNRKACKAKIINYGQRDLMKAQLEFEIEKAKINALKSISAQVSATPLTSFSAKKNKLDLKRQKLASVLEETLESEEETDEKDELIKKLRLELDEEKESHQKCREELESLKLALLDPDSDATDIGNGIVLKKSALSALKSVSPTLNVYARNVFKLVFQVDEVVGRSLMGKKCNANPIKATLSHEAVNEKKRDAVIQHSLSTFEISPGSHYYKLSLRDVKHTLCNLIIEMNLSAKKIEAAVDSVQVQEN